jgi:hypothetical protein
MIESYTLANFRTETQLRLNEPSGGGMWTDAELNTLINQAIVRVAMDTRVIKKDVSINVTANFSVYRLPEDNLIPEFLYGSTTWGQERIFPTNLLALDKMAMGYGTWEKDNFGKPRNFVPFSWDQFILWPPPDAVSTVNLHYIPYPSQLVNDTDTTLFPLSAQRLVPIFASYLAQMKNDVVKAVTHLNEYKQRLTSVQEQQRHNEQTRPSSIVPARNFDRRNANPEVGRFSSLRGYR